MEGVEGRSPEVSTWPWCRTRRPCSRGQVRRAVGCCGEERNYSVSSGTAEFNVLFCPQFVNGFWAIAGMLSPEGRCKTLDASADGYVRAEACGILMLVSLTPRPNESLDHLPGGSSSSGSSGLMAVLLGAAVNQDGRSSSLTAPNGPAQQSVIRQALASSRSGASAVVALQMHGTGEEQGGVG